MFFVIILILIVFAFYIFIHVYEKKKKVNLMNSAKFALAIGLLSTFIGFFLATYAANLQDNIKDKNRIIGLMQMDINNNINTIKYASIRANLIQGIVDKKFNDDVWYPIIIEDTLLTNVSNSGEFYKILSNDFVTTIPMFLTLNTAFSKYYDPKGNTVEDITLLKRISALKYSQVLLMQEEIKYLNGKINGSKHTDNVENIMKQLGDNMILALQNNSIVDIIPKDFFKDSSK